MKGEFLFKSKDSFGEETEEYFVGDIVRNLDDDLNEIFFDLKNENNELKIELKNKKIRIHRKSSYNLLIDLKFNGEKTSFLYEIENFRQKFLVLGKKFSYNSKNGIFDFSYVLYDENNIEVNRIEMSIKHLRCYN